MGAAAGLLILSALAGARDDSAFTDAATARLVRAAQARHAAADRRVVAYAGRFRFRGQVGGAGREWQRAVTAWATELDGRVRWAAPSDLDVQVEGRRTTRRFGFDPELDVSRPWFFPRHAGDSLRVFFADYPARPALHPLAGDGPAWYRYALVDSLVVTVPGGGARTLYEVEVRPRRTAPSLVAGRLWLDAPTAELVRLTVRFVGTAVRDRASGGGTALDRREATEVSRYARFFQHLDADLEYQLVEGSAWLPFRQTISGLLRFAAFGDAIGTFTATTTFSDLEVTAADGAPGAVTGAGPPPGRGAVRVERDADGARRVAGDYLGGTFSLAVPSRDSLAAYGGWEDSLRLEPSPAETARLLEARAAVAGVAERLPGAMRPRPGLGLGLDRPFEWVRFNRVQGFAPGLALRSRLPIPFTTATVSARVGTADAMPYGTVAVQRDAPGGQWTLVGYHLLADQDPFSRGATFANSVRAALTGRDEADYLRVLGGALRFQTSLATGHELLVQAEVERERSAAARVLEAPLFALTGPERLLGDNPPVVAGMFAGPVLALSGLAPWGGYAVAATGRLGAGRTGGRLTASTAVAVPVLGGAVVRLRGGLAHTDGLPQLAFRAGGLFSVRGYEYAAQRGDAFWSAQADIPLWRGPVRPVLFADAGQARGPDGGAVLLGGGAGLSLFGGIARLDLSVPFAQTDGRRARLDLTAFAVR